MKKRAVRPSPARFVVLTGQLNRHVQHILLILRSRVSGVSKEAPEVSGDALATGPSGMGVSGVPWTILRDADCVRPSG